MTEEIIKNITIKQLKKADLCIEDFSEEHLYDYCTIEEFYESVVNDLNQETDIIEFDNACKSFIEQAKKIKVFKYNAGTTYSNYVTNCCALATVTNLTVSGTTAKSATLTWTAPSPTTGITKLQVRDENGNVKKILETWKQENIKRYNHKI